MRLHTTQRQYGYEINVAPLIDVVFLLIIFFLTVSRIAQVKVETLSLPEATTGKESKETGSGRITINVHKDGRVTASGSTQSMDSLRQMLVDQTKHWGRGTVPILVRGDRNAPWAKVSEIMEVCTATGVGETAVAVVEPGENGAGL